MPLLLFEMQNTDSFQFFFDFFGVFCLCVENFVTPFSILAMVKGSLPTLPTNSATPDRLRCADAGPQQTVNGKDFPGYGVRTSSQKSLFKRSGI